MPGVAEGVGVAEGIASATSPGAPGVGMPVGVGTATAGSEVGMAVGANWPRLPTALLDFFTNARSKLPRAALCCAAAPPLLYATPAISKHPRAAPTPVGKGGGIIVG